VQFPAAMKRVLLLFVLGACGSVETPGEPDAGDTTDAPAASDAPPAVPLVSDVLADDCGAYTPASGVGAGDDLHRVTLADPAAMCNDGTRAVMYVRPAAAGGDPTRWVFYLQGGGGCGTARDCAIRYCAAAKYTKAKMSSRWTPMAANTDGQGLLDRDGVNPFADANLVLLYYCSSDQWLGRRSDTVLADAEEPALAFRLHFRGATILDAALDQLLAGPVTSEDGAATVPSLAAATSVLWAGTSAGAHGVEQSLDRVAARLAANGTEVRGVFDANLPPQPSDLGDPAAEAGFTAYARDTQWPIYVSAYDALVDESCLAANPGEAWRCGQNEHVVLHHVTTPFFVRQDLRDRTIGRPFLENGATEDQLAAAYRRTLVRIPPAAGLYVPNCGQHVALTNEEWFTQGTVENNGGSGAALTFRAALAGWLTGVSIRAVDTEPRSLSTCPPPVDSSE
jgi:hypothetical protein